MSLKASQQPTVAIVGFGYIGCALGAALADRGMRVTGIDPSERIRSAVGAGRSPFNEPGLEDMIAAGVTAGRLQVTDDYAAIADADVVLITVGTPLSDDGAADVSQITAASRQAAEHARDGQLFVLKSTVPPHTTQNIVAPILREAADVRIAFCPERLAEGQALRDLFSIPVVVGGIDEASTTAAAEFWRAALEVETVSVASALAAELVKLADNLWIDLNIALANELAMLCDKLGGVDVLEVIKAANTLPKVDHNVNILIPSMGVGGYCLTKDPWFVHGMGAQFGLDLKTPVTSRQVNDSMPAYTAALIDEWLLDDGEEPASKRIAVLGLAFKNHTGDVRFTPTAPAIAALRERGYQLAVFDPWVTDEDAAQVAGQPPEASIEATLAGADCVAFLAGHREFHEIGAQRLAELLKPGALVIDGRIFFDREQIAALRAAGLRYKGIGR